MFDLPDVSAISNGRSPSPTPTLTEWTILYATLG
jgi:hypothetical protein